MAAAYSTADEIFILEKGVVGGGGGGGGGGGAPNPEDEEAEEALLCAFHPACPHAVPDSTVQLGCSPLAAPLLQPDAQPFYLCCTCRKWNCGRHGDMGLCHLCQGRSCCRALAQCGSGRRAGDRTGCGRDFGAACCGAGAALACAQCAFVSCAECALVSGCDGCRDPRLLLCMEHAVHDLL